MKKYVSLLLILVLLLGGCAGKETKNDDEILQQRRDIAEAHMRHMMGALWETDQDISYSYAPSSLGVNADAESRIIHLKKGTLYSGMPYTHGSGGGDSFFHFGRQDENGIYQMSGLTTELLNGSGGSTSANNIARLSNDCADAVYWAWSRVGTSISFTLTVNMTEARGCLPVGSYKTEPETYKKTRELVQENGEAVMLNAYSQLQKADAVVTFNGEGHAMMVASVNVVKNGNLIDKEESYVLVHEQFTSNYHNEVTYVDENTGRTVYCLGGVDRKYTFAQLMKKGYVPVTIKELVDPAPPENTDIQDSAKKFDVNTVTSGSLITMAKIDMVTVTITDEGNAVVQQATAFATESTHIMFQMSVFEEPLEKKVMLGELDVKALAPGKYHCKTECLLGTGETVTVRDFDFTVESTP